MLAKGGDVALKMAKAGPAMFPIVRNPWLER
jgi:hypothetical protein